MKNAGARTNVNLDFKAALLVAEQNPPCILCGAPSKKFSTYKIDPWTCLNHCLPFPSLVGFGLCNSCLSAATPAQVLAKVESKILNNLLKKLPADLPAIDVESGELVRARTASSTGFWN
jgi:hypothetical protein